MMYALGKVLVFMTHPLGRAVTRAEAHLQSLRGAYGSDDAAVRAWQLGPAAAADSHLRSATPAATDITASVASTPTFIPAILSLLAPALEPTA